MTIIIRVMLGALALVVALAAAGAAYQWFAARADREQFPARGILVNVDGLDIHVDCRGNGRPVVVLEAGLTTGSSSWGIVHDAVSRHTSVCAYDRPGIGWSEPLGRPVSAGEVADRLHDVLAAAALKGPYVLLGMSAGGVYVREYFRRYPEEVSGMVLVDSSHEQQGNRLPAADGQNDVERMIKLCSWLQPLGAVRLTGALDLVVDQPGVPESMKPLLRANANQSHYCAAMLAESQAFQGDIHDAGAPSSLGDLPLVVLSQGNEPRGNEAFGFSDEQARAQRVVWDELQRELAALSSRGKRVVARNSGHVIQLEQPELVIAEVTALISSLRTEYAHDPIQR